MFGFFKKNKKEDFAEMTEDEKDIAKAKEDISEKGADSQTEKDREDESVGEQEKRDGDENSQDAEDRIDESEGTEKADEERAEDEGKNDPAEEKSEETDGDKQRGALWEEIVTAIPAAVDAAVTKAVNAAMDKALADMERQPQEAAPEESEALNKLENIYNS